MLLARRQETIRQTPPTYSSRVCHRCMASMQHEKDTVPRLLLRPKANAEEGSHGRAALP